MKIDSSISNSILQIEDLDILRTIGKGKTCTVRTAKLPKSENLFAVKQFKSYSSAQQDIRNETVALQALQHPNIIELVAFDKRNLVLEYLPNGELFDLIAKKKMPENIAKFFFNELISALLFVHENGFAHRDIKLENILISKDYSVKLADFGFAAPTQEGQKFERIMGTEGYMAPELQARCQYDGKKVDVFALGVVLFSMVNGIPPFFKAVKSDPYYKFFMDGNTDAYWNHLAKKYNNPISNSFKDLITRMLASNPEERISSSEIFEHPWMMDEPACSADEAHEFIREVLSESD